MGNMAPKSKAKKRKGSPYVLKIFEKDRKISQNGPLKPDGFLIPKLEPMNRDQIFNNSQPVEIFL